MLQAAENGAQIVFICNLVDVAQALAKNLADTGRVPVEHSLPKVWVGVNIAFNRVSANLHKTRQVQEK